MIRAGLVMMQLAVPRLRSASAIKAFNQQFRRCCHDLRTWRDSERLSPRDTQVLDANGGLGWDLAGALLRPRDIQACTSSFRFSPPHISNVQSGASFDPPSS